jgi:hypothetical protein
MNRTTFKQHLIVEDDTPAIERKWEEHCGISFAILSKNFLFLVLSLLELDNQRSSKDKYGIHIFRGHGGST